MQLRGGVNSSSNFVRKEPRGFPPLSTEENAPQHMDVKRCVTHKATEEHSQTVIELIKGNNRGREYLAEPDIKQPTEPDKAREQAHHR